MICDLKTNRVTQVKMGGSVLKLKYRSISGIDCIEKITLEGISGPSSVRVQIVFDPVTINTEIEPELFSIKEK
ncbi:MAG: hypothetical protein ACLFQB_15560 [Chitinispirillaceae bacterium]